MIPTFGQPAVVPASPPLPPMGAPPTSGADPRMHPDGGPTTNMMRKHISFKELSPYVTSSDRDPDLARSIARDHVLALPAMLAYVVTQLARL